MLNSTDINLLEPHVAANCRLFIERMADEAGYPVKITGTVRDDEYQAWCVKMKYATALTPSFHAISAGLAFDICKSGRTQAECYDDMAFWRTAGRIGEEMGFTWGGRWTRFTDMPHFQWDEHGKYTGNMIRWGYRPAPMPLWEDIMTGEQIYGKLNEYLAGLPCPEWALEEYQRAVDAGITDGSNPCVMIPRYQAAIMALRSKG